MAQRTLPLLFINLGGEMMYILDQVNNKLEMISSSLVIVN